MKAGARPYEGTKEVTHLLWYLATEEGLSMLEAQGPRGLNGLRVAPYYGCQLLRPSSVMGFEDPDRPQSLERLITALGGEVADYEAKSKCCGFPIILAREEVALRESHVALSQSRDAGADCMVTPCPLCHLAMDAYQRKAEAAQRDRVQHAGAAPAAAHRPGPRHRHQGHGLQAPHGAGRPRPGDGGRLDERRGLPR